MDRYFFWANGFFSANQKNHIIFIPIHSSPDSNFVLGCGFERTLANPNWRIFVPFKLGFLYPYVELGISPRYYFSYTELGELFLGPINLGDITMNYSIAPGILFINNRTDYSMAFRIEPGIQAESSTRFTLGAYIGIGPRIFLRDLPPMEINKGVDFKLDFTLGYKF